MTDTYHVWCRHSSRPHLDGYVSATTYPPRDNELCTFEMLKVTEDWGVAQGLIREARRGGNDPVLGYEDVTMD